MKAQWIKTSGEVIDVEPKNGFAFTLEELQAFVEGNGSKTVQFVGFPSGRQLVCNDNGRLIGLEENEEAFKIWQKEFPAKTYTFNNTDKIVGNVLISDPEWVGVVSYDGRTIVGSISDRRVFLEDRDLDKRSELTKDYSLKFRNHSPDGFAWGYSGSGPAQLALAILLELTDEKTAEAAYTQFKFDKIAPLDGDKDFELEVDDVLEWLVEWRVAQK